MPTTEEGRVGEDPHDRVGEEEDDEQVDQGCHPKGEREAAHIAGRKDVEDHCGEQVDQVSRDDRSPGPSPAGLDGSGQSAAFAHLVTDPLEVDDKRVRGDTDRHDDAGDTGESEPEVRGPAQPGQREIGEHSGRDKGDHRDQAEQAVLDQGVADDEEQADQAGEQAQLELLTAQRRADVVLGLQAEGHRQRTELELLGQRPC